MQPAQEKLAWEIFDSLDWNLKHHLRQADNIVRVMQSDMKLHGIKTADVENFMRERIAELLEINRVIAERELMGQRAPKRRRTG